MGQYKAQFISMILMIVLGIGMFVGFQMEWVSIERNTEDFFTETGFADYRLVSENGFSEEELQTIAQLDGVDAAARYLAVNAEVKQRAGDSVAMTVTTDPAVSGCKYISGAVYDPESEDGIWLSDRYAKENDISVGDPLTLVYKGLELSGTVRGLVKSGEYLICVRDESQLMPDFTTYGFAYLSPRFYEKTVGTAFYPQIHVLSSLSKADFIERVDQVLPVTPLILTRNEVASYVQAQGEANEGKTMGAVLPTLFLLIAVLTMVTTMHRLTAKEKTQIGTLKALGFRDRRIARHYTSYALAVGLIGTVFGVALGYGVAWYIMNPDGMMGTYFDMPAWKLYLPWFCVVILLAMLALLTLIGYLSVRQILHGNAADALRPYAPKRMKPLLLERTKLFHRFSFGTRWNLRDVMRHKSRTAMSLVGIIGCMIILVCAFGMRDTMDGFLDLYYNGALGYNSRIYLAEDATQEQKEALLERYDGDWSASLSVQLEEKTVSLDIYELPHDMVRFPAKSGKYTELKDDGAYVCLRIADEFGLSVGDRFTVSPYGSDAEYTLRVAGLIRSVSESVVITPEYAAAVGIPVHPDTIYTESESVAADAAIKSVQSRQAVMDSFDTFTEIMDTMIWLFVAGALLLGVIVLYNLGVMSYTERYREMATLKVIGFRDAKIGRLLIGQNMWLSIVGAVVGLPAGVGVLSYMLDKLAGEYEMKLMLGWRTYVFSLLLTFGMSLLVGLLVSRKNRKIDMVEALKGAE